MMFNIKKPDVTWCILRSLHKEWRPNVSIRKIFSKTGDWPKNLTTTVKKDIESHWKDYVQTHHLAKPRKSKQKYYVLSMFPYPSGQLHMGHTRVYTISDTMARFHRMNDKQVIHPMGWDAFGLPAENAAIERGVQPDKWTYSNIATMKQQLADLCYSFDWDREVTTCSPEYYRWTQHIFLMMYHAGLVYRKNDLVNWDPVDRTVLANEQVDEDGRSWRSGAVIEKKVLRQWYIRTTAYAQDLLNGLSEVDSSLWRDIVKLQKHWIGDCNGCLLDFRLQFQDECLEDPLTIWTPSPQGIFGVSHVIVSHDHYLNSPVYYKDKSKTSGDIELAVKVIHPITKHTMPVFVSEMEFPEKRNSWMGIPDLCETDQIFATSHNIEWVNITNDDGTLTNSQQLNGLSLTAAFNVAANYAKENKFGGSISSSRLHDWSISRQRYWGTPIPIVHCQNCKTVPVPYDQLPVTLPISTTVIDKGDSFLKLQDDWINVKCPKCGCDAKRETNTMDTFVDSAWYFLRYTDSSNTEEPFNKWRASHDMPVDLYIGGKEHATCHLFFARFFNHFLYKQGMLDVREPFVNLMTQGMVLGQTYKVEATGKYLRPDQVNYIDGKPTEKDTGDDVLVEWEKMSKSKHNGADPQDVLDEHGVDSTRLCVLGVAAPKSDRLWKPSSFTGIIKWQVKLWDLIDSYLTSCSDSPDVTGDQTYEDHCYQIRNATLREVSMHYNVTFLLHTALTKIMMLTKELRKVPVEVMGGSAQFERSLASLIVTITPMAPSFASELWRGFTSVRKLTNDFDWSRNVLDQSWPSVDQDYNLPLSLRIKTYEYVFEMVNLPRETLEGLTQEEARKLMESTAEFKRLLGNKDISDIEFTIYPQHHAELRYYSKDFTLSNKELQEKSKIRKELKRALKKNQEPDQQLL